MADTPKETPAPKAGAAPTILTPKSLRFEVVYPHWSHLPKGSILTEKALNGPDNVARLIAAGCVAPVAE